MTTTIVSLPPSEVMSDRYATRAAGGKKVGHLLPRTWVEEPGHRGRPAMCGVRAQRWRPVRLFAEPEAFIDCGECSATAGISKPVETPVRIAPETRSAAPRHDPMSITPAGPNLTQAERQVRRAAFRDAFHQPQ